MQALTLEQPWATAVLHGPIRVLRRERRLVPGNWGLPAWVALYASSERDEAAQRRLRTLWPAHRSFEYPGGYLLGVVCLADVSPVEEMAPGEGPSQPWCLQIGEAYPLARPIRCMGGEGLWDIEASLSRSHAASQVGLHLRTLRALIPGGAWIPPRRR